MQKASHPTVEASAVNARQFIGVAPFVSVLKEEDLRDGEEPTSFEIGLWRSEANECDDQAGSTPCEITAGIFYGTSDVRDPKFCPRHFYERHIGTKATNRIELVGESTPTNS
jgi:hypothetical protein